MNVLIKLIMCLTFTVICANSAKEKKKEQKKKKKKKQVYDIFTLRKHAYSNK